MKIAKNDADGGIDSQPDTWISPTPCIPGTKRRTILPLSFRPHNGSLAHTFTIGQPIMIILSFIALILPLAMKGKSQTEFIDPVVGLPGS